MSLLKYAVHANLIKLGRDPGWIWTTSIFNFNKPFEIFVIHDWK